MIDAYDNHNILILPSFTEGQPYVVDESLARRRPVIIFEDIAHIIKERKGIFVSKRTVDSFCETTLSQIQVSRGLPLGDGTRLSPMNPVFLLKGKLP